MHFLKRCSICKFVGFFAGLGAFNWFSIAFAKLDLVSIVIGKSQTALALVYTIMGLVGVMCLASAFRACPSCSQKAEAH